MNKRKIIAFIILLFVIIVLTSILFLFGFKTQINEINTHLIHVKANEYDKKVEQQIIEEVEEVVVKEEVVEEEVVEVDYMLDNTIKFCNEMTHWEGRGQELNTNNFHGVTYEGVVVPFPFNSYTTSYEWCIDNAYQYMADKATMTYYLCNIYMSVNTCNNKEEFFEKAGL